MELSAMIATVLESSAAMVLAACGFGGGFAAPAAAMALAADLAMGMTTRVDSDERLMNG